MARKAGIKNNGKFLFVVAAILGIGAFATVVYLLTQTLQTEEYYVLNTDVMTGSEIVPEMLEPVVVSSGGSPQNAVPFEAIQAGGILAQYSLMTGDVLTISNTSGARGDISIGVPEEWVVTNFSVEADSAVGGRIQRGTYFDVLVAEDENREAFYPFVNLLALDATVSLTGASSATAVETEEAYSGQTSQYTVGMPPGDAAILHNILSQYGSQVKLVLSPKQNQYNPPRLSDYEGVFSYLDTRGETKNLGENTDPTFTPVERDISGEPLEEVVNCGDGNTMVSGDDCDLLGQPISGDNGQVTEEDAARNDP